MSDQPSSANDADRSRVLLVDDTRLNLQVLFRTLDGRGLELLIAQNGTEALRIAGEAHPHLILLDIMMPDLDGFEVCRRLKADPATADVPVIFLSALSQTEDKVKGFEQGAVDYITKPFQSEEVIARVNTHLTIHRLQQNLERTNTALVDLNATLEQKVAERTQEVVRSRDAIIFGLAKLAESRDNETGEHLERICRYVDILAREIADRDDGLDEQWVRTMTSTAALHDIGKVGIPDAVLRKPGKLTDEEREVMERHTTIGGDMLFALKQRWGDDSFLITAMEIVFGHHERWDGGGYPFGLAGDAIPFPARIVAVADVYDALRSKRVYKPAMSHEKARSIIEEGAGAHFDPAVVHAFLNVGEAFRKVVEASDDDLVG